MELIYYLLYDVMCEKCSDGKIQCNSIFGKQN